MTNNTPDTDAASTTKSLSNRDTKSVQPSALDVAVPYSTLIENQSSEKMQETLVILMSLLQGLTENVMSGDIITLSCYRAADISAKAGIPPEQIDETLRKFMDAAKQNRSRNPMSSMF